MILQEVYAAKKKLVQNKSAILDALKANQPERAKQLQQANEVIKNRILKDYKIIL